MKKLLGYAVLGILVTAPVAVYTVRDQALQSKSYQEQCELLSLQYELRAAREMLQAEKGKVEQLSDPKTIASMREQVESLTCKIQGFNAQLQQNSDDINKINREAERKMEEHAGVLTDTVTADLKKAEGQIAQEFNKIQDLANSLSTNADLQKSTISEMQNVLHRDSDEMTKMMVLPTVQLNGVDTVGSGVIVASEADAKGSYTTYALTSYHVVRNILAESEAGQKPLIRLNTYDSKDPKEEIADLIVFDEDLDIALLKLRMDRKYPYTAKFCSKDKANEVTVFTPIYAVGCPLGNDPIPTVGEIASTRNQINSQNYWMLNAPTYFGNSGGGIFLSKNHELVGIFSKIYTHGHGRPVVISHMGLATPISTVQDWMTKVGYGRLCEQKVEKVATPAAEVKK